MTPVTTPIYQWIGSYYGQEFNGTGQNLVAVGVSSVAGVNSPAPPAGGGSYWLGKWDEFNSGLYPTNLSWWKMPVTACPIPTKGKITLWFVANGTDTGYDLYAFDQCNDLNCTHEYWLYIGLEGNGKISLDYTTDVYANDRYAETNNTFNDGYDHFVELSWTRSPSLAVTLKVDGIPAMPTFAERLWLNQSFKFSAGAPDFPDGYGTIGANDGVPAGQSLYINDVRVYGTNNP